MMSNEAMTNTAKPSEPSLAQAFWEQHEVPRGDHAAISAYVDKIIARAREIEATRPPSSEQAGERKMAPVQGYSAGIPWSLHREAWDAYAKKYGKNQTAERLADRGGFGTEELDDFIPGWRDRVSEITALREEVKRLSEAAPAKPCEAEDEPDKYCITAGDYSCISNNPRCMHNRPEPRTGSDIYCDVEAGRLRGDELFFPQNLAQSQRQGRAVGYVSALALKSLIPGEAIRLFADGADGRVPVYIEQPASAAVGDAVLDLPQRWRNAGYDASNDYETVTFLRCAEQLSDALAAARGVAK